MPIDDSATNKKWINNVLFFIEYNVFFKSITQINGRLYSYFSTITDGPDQSDLYPEPILPSPDKKQRQKNLNSKFKVLEEIFLRTKDPVIFTNISDAEFDTGTLIVDLQGPFYTATLDLPSALEEYKQHARATLRWEDCLAEHDILPSHSIPVSGAASAPTDLSDPNATFPQWRPAIHFFAQTRRFDRYVVDIDGKPFIDFGALIEPYPTLLFQPEAIQKNPSPAQREKNQLTMLTILQEIFLQTKTPVFYDYKGDDFDKNLITMDRHGSYLFGQTSIHAAVAYFRANPPPIPSEWQKVLDDYQISGRNDRILIPNETISRQRAEGRDALVTELKYRVHDDTLVAKSSGAVEEIEGYWTSKIPPTDPLAPKKETSKFKS